MRRILEALYRGSGILAGCFLVGIAVMSLTQIFGRLLGFNAHSFDEFAGYSMAAASFLGLAWTFRCNEHIRVSLVHGRTKGGARRVLELTCLLIASSLIGYFAWSTVAMVWLSFSLDDVSQGLVPVKLWIPQSGVALGLVILLIALIDDLLVVARGEAASYDVAARASAGESPSFER
jgi:TRAP-type C4-dicarboxylate transport system permease small subunit